MGKTALAMVAAILVVSALSGCSGGKQDTTAPRISAVSIRDATRTSVVITWVTDEPATSQVDYGLADRYDRSTRVGTKLVVNHSVTLMGLDANTTYHYRVYSEDAAGNEAFSADSTFSTSDIAAPVISEVSVGSVTGVSATVGWTTSEPATSQVEYGLTDQYSLATTLDTELVTSHNVKLTGLSSNKLYHFRVISKDAANRESYSGDYSFTTGTAGSIVISPAAATITAGGTQAYSAEAFDRFNNSLGDVTAGTTFSVDAAAGGSWAANVYTSHHTGTWTVTGSYGGATAAASLTVSVGSIGSIVIYPAASTIMAGNTQTYTAEAFDRFDNSLGDVTAGASFSISPDAGGSWAANVYTSRKAGTWTVTGNYAGRTATATLTVTRTTPSYIVISPEAATIMAGNTQTYTAEAFDQYDNSLGNVTAGTTFSIEGGAGGSWAANIYTSRRAGNWTVRGDYSGLTGTAILTVTRTPPSYIVVSPDAANILAGNTQAYTAEAFDQYDNSLGDVTAGTIFSIDTAAGGSWVDNVYTSQNAGPWTVMGTYGDLIDPASLYVSAPYTSYIIISPGAAGIMAGGTQAYSVEAFDQFDNSLGDVTAETAFSIDPAAGGLWSANIYTSVKSGTWTVTGDYGGLTDTAFLTVNPGSATSLDLTSDNSVAYAGVPFDVTVTAYDAYGNVATGYRGTVSFTSTDNGATLPESYAFTESDSGMHTFGGVILVMPSLVGSMIQVTDGTLTDSETWVVFPA